LTPGPGSATFGTLVRTTHETYPLDDARADGWLDKLGEGQPAFAKLCDILGEHFVGFSVISGVRITAIALDGRAPERSMVDFAIGDEKATQRLPLGELRRKLAEIVIAETKEAAALPLGPSPSVEMLQSRIGFRWVLLAPIYDFRLEALHVEPGGQASITVARDGTSTTMPLDELKDALRTCVRADMARAAQGRVSSPFSIDLALVPQALEAAERGDHEKVVALLGSWPGPLSVLLRTAEGQGLGPEQRTTLARALGALGTAHARLGKLEWGQEVLRLGIQWAQDGAAAGEIFARLGRLALEGERAGEAIGLLRRALGLGADAQVVLPALATALAARGRNLPALVVAKRARALGVANAELDAAEAKAGGAKLGAAFREFVRAMEARP
jgi:hypothetical protein